MIKERTIRTAAFKRALLGSTIITGMIGLAIAADEPAKDDALEEIVVTGSRIKQKEFSSASPIQVISGEVSRELGLFNTSEMLQGTAQTTGLQIDNTFTSFVLDNGPGAETLGFRGLDPERTLILINGRRIAPAGVGGAPTSPDLSLIPTIMVDRVENLLDGASAVYGSDAVAGVANIIMRKGVEGFDIEGSVDETQHSGGRQANLSAMWGKSWDRGSFMIGGEYQYRQRIAYNQRSFTKNCDEYLYEDENGNILSQYRGLIPGTTPSACKLSTINRMFYINPFGNLWYTPGKSNLIHKGTSGFGIPFAGVPNWSETSIGRGLEVYNNALRPVDTDGNGSLDTALVDPDGNGLGDVDLQTPFYNAAMSDRYLSGDLSFPLKQFSIYSSGEFRLEDDNNSTLYFEGLYADRKLKVFNPGATVFPDVPVENPYNPCGYYGVDCLGFFGPFGGYDQVTPIVAIQGDRDNNKVHVYQYRVVGGIKGDLGFMNNAGLANWTWDAYAAYSRSVGRDHQRGILGDRLEHSINTSRFEGGKIVCGTGNDGCVPVNMFASSIYQAGGGVFGTQAETDYLFGDRRFKTVVEQTLFSAYATGDLFKLPWNDEAVPVVIGAEHRRDKIASIPDQVAAEGLLYAYFSDKGASGSRTLTEFYSEVQLPLLKGQKGAEELSITGSGRWTDESYSKPAWTYSVKGIYRPVDWFTIRGTWGTSYRTPNLRERFLNETTGFNTVSDPCVVPADARIPGPTPTSPATYDPTKDNRVARVLAACQANGVNPTTLGLNPAINSAYSTEIGTGGTGALNEETSRAYTWGVVVKQPWSESFDLSFAATVYDIKVKNSIEEPGPGFIVARCLNNPDEPNGDSDYCARITRGSDGLIDKLDASFINIGRITAKGIDFNLLYDQDFEIGARTLSVNLDVRATRTREQIYQVVDTIDDNAGETDTPFWRANGTLRLKMGDWGFNWFTRWIQGGKEDEPAFQANAVPCQGMAVKCRPVWYTSNYDVHDMSVSWTPGDTRVTIGMSNVFDKKPPRVDTDGVFGINNMPIGVGYDVRGRSFFVSARQKF